MKTKKLYMQQWLKANGREQTQSGDNWYLDFANQLLAPITGSSLFKNQHSDVLADVALRISLYFYDTIAQSGGWKNFTTKHNALYGKPLPFYDCQHYIDDEINPVDIYFLLWSGLSQVEDNGSFHFQHPHDKELLRLGNQLYNEMDQSFEEAPVCEKVSPASWVTGSAQLEIPNTPLPEITPESRLTKDVERCLQYSQGNPLLYFAGYQELHTFLTDILKWENHSGGIFPDLKEEKNFVIYANAKGMLLAPGVAACFRDSANPTYNAETASQMGYKLFCLPGYCPFDLLKYGMKHNLLADVALPFSGGKEILQNHWDFIARYFLGEYYEGD